MVRLGTTVIGGSSSSFGFTLFIICLVSWFFFFLLLLHYTLDGTETHIVVTHLFGSTDIDFAKALDLVVATGTLDGAPSSSRR
jgi:hypothetical protein